MSPVVARKYQGPIRIEAKGKKNAKYLVRILLEREIAEREKLVGEATDWEKLAGEPDR